VAIVTVIKTLNRIPMNIDLLFCYATSGCVPQSPKPASDYEPADILIVRILARKRVESEVQLLSEV